MGIYQKWPKMDIDFDNQKKYKNIRFYVFIVFYALNYVFESIKTWKSDNNWLVKSANFGKNERSNPKIHWITPY